MKIQELDKTYIAGTYGRFPVTLVSGKGSRVQDENGKEYTDLGSGIAVTSFGIADDAWTKAVTQQLQTLQHTSNLYYTEPCAHLAQMLCEKSGMKKVFFGNSGAEANECAIKVARKYAAEKKGSENNVIITLKNSFHGRTLTTLAALPAGEVPQRRIGGRMFELVHGGAVRCAQDQGECIIGGESGAEPVIGGGQDLALAGGQASGKLGDVLCLEVAVRDIQREAFQGKGLFGGVHDLDPGVQVVDIFVGGDLVQEDALERGCRILLLAGGGEQRESGKQCEGSDGFHHWRIPSFLRYASAFTSPPVFLMISSQYS